MNKRIQPTEPSTIKLDQPMIYQIRVEGHLNGHWSEWFDGLSITLQSNGDTLLTGPVVDQAALYGLLKKVRDLGIPLVSLKRMKAARQAL